MRHWWAWIAAALVSGPVWAQQEQPEPSAPEPVKDDSPRKRPKAPKGLAPSAPPTSVPVEPGMNEGGSVPGLEDADFFVGTAALRAEGAFLVAQRGAMVELPTGDRAFVFHRDAEGKAERPMLLMPSTNLSRMEQLAAAHGDPAVFRLSGQVFVYEGRNYILPTLPPVIVGAEAPAEATEPGAPGGAEGPSEADEGLAGLMKSLEGQRARPRALERTAASGPALSVETSGTVLVEGTFLSRKRGRLVRLSGGEWALTVDADVDAPADQPMLLLPCQNLERMEMRASAQGESATFEVSGRVLVYRGRNYLLTTMFQAYPASDLQRRQ